MLTAYTVSCDHMSTSTGDTQHSIFAASPAHLTSRDSLSTRKCTPTERSVRRKTERAAPRPATPATRTVPRVILPCQARARTSRWQLLHGRVGPRAAPATARAQGQANSQVYGGSGALHATPTPPSPASSTLRAAREAWSLRPTCGARRGFRPRWRPGPSGARA